jgi:hypothetical protein
MGERHMHGRGRLRRATRPFGNSATALLICGKVSHGHQRIMQLT